MFFSSYEDWGSMITALRFCRKPGQQIFPGIVRRVHQHVRQQFFQDLADPGAGTDARRNEIPAADGQCFRDRQSPAASTSS